ncbi:hypothetical protein [Flavobacterium hercynium]|uniref:Uncharacterized protein n=1 Tax=Flavobacterium hercynium TaxID=387094 RepID=A0A226GSR8_9FLAO|nr:hypothetical protein [Flavobacterium hercynium]OXA84588.1 hypothetical protein B0A66_20760 [Flavobacterium hercynium]SMP15477.1 hypothetical protein SAMN06265346_104220 [Flavobacterium hercynium]
MSKLKLKVNPGINDIYNPNNSYIKIENSKSNVKDKSGNNNPIVHAVIENWNELTEAEKKDTVWIWNLVEQKLSFLDSDYNKFIGKGYSGGIFQLPTVYSGNAVAWLEPYIHGVTSPTGSPRNGLFVSGKTTPKVVGYEWREYSSGNNGAIIKGDIKYGETIQLHIYTEGLYGDEIQIDLYDVQFKDEDLPLFEKDNGVYQNVPRPKKEINKENAPISHKTLTREVKVHDDLQDRVIDCELYILNITDENNIKTTKKSVQKCVVDIYVDPIWAFFVNKEKNNSQGTDNSIEMKAYIYTAVNNQYLRINNTDNQPLVKILGKTNEKTALEPEGNKVVVAGTIETNIANFLPCRFSRAVGKYARGEETVEIEIYNIQNNLNLTKLVFPLVAGIKEARKDFTIELEGLQTKECIFADDPEKTHTGHVIDISKIEKLIENGKGKRSEKWRAAEYKSNSVSKENPNVEAENHGSDESTITNNFKFINGISSLKAQSSFKVLEEHKPFVLQPPTDEKLELQVGYDFSHGNTISPIKGLLATLWPNNENLAQRYPVNLHTCCPNIPLDIMVYPDTKWTLQLAFNYDGEEFNKLRDIYHDKWKLKELEAKDDLKKIKGQSQNLDDDEKKKRKKLREAKAKAKKAKAKAKRKQSYRSQASHMMSKTTNVGLIDCEFSLMCEFDRPHQALELSSGMPEITDFLKKVGDVKDLIESIFNGKNDNTTKNSPKGNSTTSARSKRLKDNLKLKNAKKKEKSNWSYEFIPPSVGVSVSWYADPPKDLYTPVMGTMIEGAIDLDPLFGFEIKYDAYQLLYKINHPAVLAVVATLDILDEALGDDFNINLDLIITSEISGSLKGTINTAEGSKYTERLMKDDDDSPCKLGGKVLIKLVGDVNGNFGNTIFGFIKRTAYAKLEAEIMSGISIECVTKADKDGIYIEPEIKFEGFVLSAKVDAGIVDPPVDDTELSEADGLHYTAEGRIVILDPYEWQTGWKLPLLSI